MICLLDIWKNSIQHLNYGQKIMDLFKVLTKTWFKLKKNWLEKKNLYIAFLTG